MFPDISEIKRRRKLLGVSQKELASMADVSRPSLNKLEGGDSDLSYSKVKSIFEALERIEGGPGSWQLLTGRLGDFHSRPIEFVSVEEAIQSVSRRMIETNFSQFPVKDGDRIVGSITEWGINRAISERGRDAADARVGDVLENPFPVFGVDTKVQSVIAVLRSVPAVLTVDNGIVVGILTNQDLYKKLGSMSLRV
jgi:predicted transcriptional regulator